MSVGSDDEVGDVLGQPMSTDAAPEEGRLGMLDPPDQVPAAEDPAAKDAGNILARLGGLSGPVQSFTIDIELAPQAIADLEAAAVFLERRAESVRDLTKISAPGADEISLHAVEQIGRWAVDDSANSLPAMLRAGAEQLRTLTGKLRADVQTYLQVDELALPSASEGLPR